MKKINSAILTTCIIAITSHGAIASIIDGGNVNGYDTFVDQNTGYIWMDMDSFFGATNDDIITASTQAGFNFATKSEVEVLLNSLSLANGEWLSTYKPIMMDAPNRELIWGLYDDGSDPWGYAYAFGWDTSWTFVDNIAYGNVIENSDLPQQTDMSIWAYRVDDGNEVPEPTTMLLFGTGLIGLVGARLRKKKK